MKSSNNLGEYNITSNRSNISQRSSSIRDKLEERNIAERKLSSRSQKSFDTNNLNFRYDDSLSKNGSMNLSIQNNSNKSILAENKKMNLKTISKEDMINL